MVLCSGNMGTCAIRQIIYAHVKTIMHIKAVHITLAKINHFCIHANMYMLMPICVLFYSYYFSQTTVLPSMVQWALPYLLYLHSNLLMLLYSYLTKQLFLGIEQYTLIEQSSNLIKHSDLNTSNSNGGSPLETLHYKFGYHTLKLNKLSNHMMLVILI